MKTEVSRIALSNEPPARGLTIGAHQFFNMARGLDWHGTQERLLAGLKALKYGTPRPNKNGDYNRDP